MTNKNNLGYDINFWREVEINKKSQYVEKIRWGIIPFNMIINYLLIKAIFS